MKCEWATTPWQKFAGLMMRPRIERPLVLVLASESRWLAAIHTLFMRFPIDLVFLDKRRKVVDLVRNVAPWRLNILPKKPAQYVIEMKANTTRFKPGQRISLGR